jgi:co-chaperonin GroES (HSP10)
MQAEDWSVLHDKVMVRRLEAEKERGGLAVPDKAQRQQSQGTVLRAGPGNGKGPLTVKEGDIVKFTAFSGVPLAENDESVILLREEEILAYYTP